MPAAQRRVDAWSHGWRAAAVVSTMLLVAGAVLRAPAVHDAATGAPIAGARLVLSPAYVALAPLCDLADTLAGFPLHAHYVLMFGVLVASLAWPSSRPSMGRWPRGSRTIGAGAWRLGRGIGVLLALYVIVVMVPRPAARLVMDDPDAVVVDFHSHTAASHDGRRGYTAEANRAWHAAMGFDVAYVTDHGTFAGAMAGMARNPHRASGGVVLLPGVEVRHAGQHLNVLGAGPADSAAYAGGTLHDSLFADRMRHHDEPPVVLLTVPADLRELSDTRDDARADAVTLDAVELSDAAPRGLEQGDRERPALTALADRRGLAVLAGSDDHGWAPNAVAWSVLRIPGWRAMTPDALDRAIRRTIRTRRRDAVQVVERRVASVASGALAAPMDEPPLRLWALCRALSWPERLAWLAWLWMPLAAYRAATRRAGIAHSRRMRIVGEPAT